MRIFEHLLARAMTKQGLSARAHGRKGARTIADRRVPTIEPSCAETAFYASCGFSSCISDQESIFRKSVQRDQSVIYAA